MEWKIIPLFSYLFCYFPLHFKTSFTVSFYELKVETLLNVGSWVKILYTILMPVTKLSLCW